MPIIASQVIRLEQISLSTGITQSQTTITSGQFVGGNCLGYDGHFLYPGHVNNLVPPQNILRKYVPDGNGFTLIQVEASTTSASHIDICFDGMFWWVLTSTHVYLCRDPGGVLNGTPLKSWLHGIASPKGIFHNGMHVGIVS